MNIEFNIQQVFKLSTYKFPKFILYSNMIENWCNKHNLFVNQSITNPSES